MSRNTGPLPRRRRGLGRTLGATVAAAAIATILWPSPAQAQAGGFGIGLMPLLLGLLVLGGSLTIMIVAANRNIANQRGRLFRAGTGVGRTTIVFVALSAVVEAALVAVFLWQVTLIKAARRGEMIDITEAERSDQTVVALSIVAVLLYVVTATAFICWLSRVRANLPAIGIDDARWGPGWAVGWWFVPIMNLFRPYQLTAEVYRASTAVTSDWRTQPAGVVGWWWFFWLASSVGASVPNMFATAGERAYLRGDVGRFQDLLLNGTYANIVVSLLSIAGAIALVSVIRRTTATQIERWTGLAQAEVFGDNADGITTGAAPRSQYNASGSSEPPGDG